MTVASDQSRKTFAGNDATTSFATTPLVFFTSADLVVTITDDDTGAVTTLVENTDYTVTGGSEIVPAVGTVSLAGGSDPYGAPASGTTLTILRDVQIVQGVDHEQNDGSDAQVAEGALDRLTMISQRLSDRLDRTLHLPDGDTTGESMELPDLEDRASKVLGFDAAGAATVYDASSAVTTSDNVTFVPSGIGAQAQSVSIWMKGKVKSIFDFIPPAIHDAIRAGTDSTDLRTYIQAAYAATPLIEWGPGVFNFSDEIDLSGYTDGVAIIGPGECSGPSFYGFGAKLVHTGTNKKGFILPPGSNHVEGIYAAYSAQQSAANTSSVLIELLNADRTKLRNLRLFYANTLIGMRQGVTNTLFNSDLTNLDLNQASLTDLDLRNVSGGGTNTKLNNIYFNGGGSLDFVTAGQSCSYAIRTAGWSGLEVHGVSFDGMEFTERLWDSSNDEVEVSTIRAEAVKCKKDNDGWFAFGGSYSKVHIGHLNVTGCRALVADCPTATYLLRANATTNVLTVDSIRIPTNANSSYTTPIFRAATIGSTNGPVAVGPISEGTAVLTDRIWTGSAFGGIVRVWDGRLISETMQADRATTNAKRIPCTAASLPTGGATGDHAVVLNPGDLGRPAEYVYSTTFQPSMFVGGQFPVNTINDEADFTLTPGTSRPVCYHTGTLTSDVAVTLSATGAWNGAIFRVTRTGSGAFNLNVGTGPLKALVQNTWADFIYDGGAWRLMAYGAL